MAQNREPKPNANAGQAALQALGLRGVAVAEALGVTPMAASYLLRGARLPSGDQRRKMLDLYGIPVEAWDRAPVVTAAGALGMVRPPRKAKTPTPTPTPTPTLTPTPALAHVVRAPVTPTVLEATHSTDPIDQVDSVIEACQKGLALQGLSATESASWQKRLMDAVMTKQKMLDAAEVREDTITRHPVWQRIKGVVLDALEAHPDALASVIAAMESAGV